MAWCCGELERRILAAGEDGFRVLCYYKEPPHNPGVKVFLIKYQPADGLGSECPGGMILLNFCPWCGAALSTQARA
jgi:hypothetical protein